LRQIDACAADHQNTSRTIDVSAAKHQSNFGKLNVFATEHQQTLGKSHVLQLNIMFLKQNNDLGWSPGWPGLRP
jgi:hypothetical protein